MSILTKAEELINGQRAKDYGDARENHQRIADLWNAYAGTDFIPDDVAVMMILLKIARLMENGYHEDTVTDIAGYAGVLEKMQLPGDKRRDLNFSIKIGEPAPTKEERDEFDRENLEPRKWHFLCDDIPDDVTRVRDRSGDAWARSNVDSIWDKSLGATWCGPFTEVTA